MNNNSNATPIINISEYSLKRDKRIVSMEMKDYFVGRNRQEKAWHLATALKSGFRQNIFSTAEAKKITGFLARKFEIRLPAIEYAQALGSSSIPRISNRGKIQGDFKKTVNGGNNLFSELFLRLQVGVQENLLDYNGARTLVEEIVTCYPKARASLQP